MSAAYPYVLFAHVLSAVALFVVIRVLVAQSLARRVPAAA